MYSNEFASSAYWRNDVAAPGVCPLLPSLYALLIVMPFMNVFARLLFKAPEKRFATVVFHLYKDSYNPFNDDVFQVTLLRYDGKYTYRVASDSYEVVSFLEGIAKDVDNVHLVFNGDKTQEIAFKRFISGLIDPDMMKKLVFVDIRMLYLYKHKRGMDAVVGRNVTVRSIARALGINHMNSFVQTYANILDHLCIVHELPSLIENESI